jgi:3-carboxy-cis,cis-muconate cycloisomerase
MAVAPIDTKLFRDMFGTEAMREVFDEVTTLQRYLDVEAALARVQANLGIIPLEAADEISTKCQVELMDQEAIAKETVIVGYPILALVRGIVRACDRGLGEYAHWGATTQDIMDTGLVLQIRDAIDLLDADLEELCKTLARLTDQYREATMAGRTHLQHALPVTFGLKTAVWLAPLLRMKDRLREIRSRVLVGQFSGASGTLASLGDKGMEVSDGLMDELGLGRALAPWHVARDSVAETVCFLALLTGALSKIAADVMLLMTTELQEVFEPFVTGRGASSTMPQKRNPISCEIIRGSARLVRSHAAACLDAMEADFERATGPWHIEWTAVPEAFVLTSGALSQANFMLAGLEVDTDRMRRNLDASNGLIMAEAVMMGLAPVMGRTSAHDAVYAACRRAIAEGTHLRDALLADTIIVNQLGPAEIDHLLEPANYLGATQRMIDRVLCSLK